MKSSEQNALRNANRWSSAWRAGATSAVILAATLLAGHVARGAMTTNAWNTTTDNYNNPAAWNPAGVPNSTNIVADVGNGGTVNYDSSMTYALGTLYLGEAAGSGTFVMSGGELDITNVNPTGLYLGNGAGGIGTLTMNGGSLNLKRQASAFFQDFLQIGYAANSLGTFTLNSGTVTCLGGIEIGSGGNGTLNVTGGTLINNGWFGIGRGGNGSAGSGTFNMSGGIVYLLRVPGNDGGLIGLSFSQGTSNAVANISGGTIYTPLIKFASVANDRDILNVSGGDIYLWQLGVASNSIAGAHSVSINLSGGTWHSVNMLTNTSGTLVTNTISTGGTNWNWAATLPINLTNNPGPGTVTFAPEATRTFTLNAPISGPGTLSVNGSGTVVLGATEQYTGGTTVSAGTLAIAAAQTNALGLSLASGATLALNTGGSLVDSPINLPSGATVSFNSGTTAQGYTNNFTGAGDVLVTGYASLTGTLGHSGKTTITTGTLAVGTTLNSATSVLVTNTGTLAGNGQIGAPVTTGSTNGVAAAHLRMGMSPLNIPGTLTINNNLSLGPGTELDIKLGTATTTGGGVNDLLVVNGNMTIDPNAYLNIIPLQQLTAGTYVIATYTGTLTGQFTNTITSLSRYGFSVDYGVSTPGQIKLTVSGSPANLVWYGMTNNVTVNVWDVLTTPDWLNSAVSSTFEEGDAVTFDDTATNCNVQIATTLYPASITFNNVNSNYSVTGTGSGRISGGTGITKKGNGTVLMAAGLGVGNDYTGPVQINGGIFKMSGALSLGATNGATIVALGATLDLNGQTPNDEPFVLQGAGFGGNQRRDQQLLGHLAFADRRSAEDYAGG